MDHKEQLRQVEAEIVRDAEETKRLSRTDAAGGQPASNREMDMGRRLWWFR